MAIDREQAEVTLEYAAALFREVPVLRVMVERETAEGLELTQRDGADGAAERLPGDPGSDAGGVHHGRDQLLAERADGQSPDVEVYRAAKPALATMPGSSDDRDLEPVPAGGAVVAEVQAALGPGRATCWWCRAPTRLLNPLIDEQMIAEALEDDPEAATAEWGAEFRD